MKRQTIIITVETNAMTDIGQQNIASCFSVAFSPIAAAFNWGPGSIAFIDVESEKVNHPIDQYLPPLN